MKRKRVTLNEQASADLSAVRAEWEHRTGVPMTDTKTVALAIAFVRRAWAAESDPVPSFDGPAYTA